MVTIIEDVGVVKNSIFLYRHTHTHTHTHTQNKKKLMRYVLRTNVYKQ